MKQREYLKLPPEESAEHQLLHRRIEWLELKNSCGYRLSQKRRVEIDSIYADVSNLKVERDTLQNPKSKPSEAIA